MVLSRFFQLSLLLASLYVFGLLLFWAALPRHSGEFNVQNESHKGLVVFTGGSKRIAEAFRQVKSGFRGPVLISGVSPVVKESVLLQKIPAEFHGQITLDYTAHTTRENVVALKRWVNAKSIQKIALVTSYYHMPRSLLSIKQSGWYGAVEPVPVLPDVLPFSFLLREYNKYLLAYIRII